MNKLLSERKTPVADNKIVSLGVILNIDEVDSFERFTALADDLKVRPNRLKIIAFSENIKDDLSLWDECYSPKDIGWKGSVKNVELQEFLNREYDALISYYEKDILELKLITALSKAKFKIGILQSDERLNDLIIKTNLQEFDLFKQEIFKYLNILNKIKE